MKTYLVGGAIRDQLLEFPVKERDWVVVGSTPEEMLKKGFRPVGKDFPVFLHPTTHEEYALARTERKTGRGYKQFIFYTAPDVTLEEDLRRRDLTINAMAQTADGEIIDPYGGRADIKNRWLRHVSSAFVEDPVRILRIARFAARYHKLGFRIAEETQHLMQEMVRHGEVDALTPERVWQELHDALTEMEPCEFFYVLDSCGALKKLFPNIKNYLKDLQISENPDPKIRFATLLLRLSENDIQFLAQQYRIPTAYKDLALLANKHQKLFENNYLSAEDIFEFFNQIDVWRRPERLKDLLEILAKKNQKNLLLECYLVAKETNAQFFIAQGLSGVSLGKKINEQRLALINNFLLNKTNQ